MIVERLRRANAKLQVEVTERRQADAEVKSLSNFPDENPDPVLRLNGQGIILYANHAGQAVLEAWKAAVGQAAPAFLLAKIAKAFETRSRQSIELSVGGRVFSFTIAPILDAGYVNLYGSDITERKQAEEAAQFLASIVDSTDDAIIGKSLDGIILSWNPGAEKLYGYPAQEAIGKPISIIALPGKPDEMQEILGKVSKGEKIEYYETERLTRDGKRIDVSLTVFPVRDRDGRIVAASMIGRDITERRQAENAIRKGQALLNETQMISKIGGWEYDMAAKRVYWTDEVYRIYGVTKEYDPGNPRQDIEFYLAGDQRKMDEAFRRAVEEGIPYDLELQLMNAAGEKLWVHTIGRAENKEGKVARVSGYIMDITERKQAEDEIARRNRELSVLYKVSQGSLSSLDLQIMLDHVTPTMIQELGGTAGGIYVLEPDGVTMTLRSHFGHSEEFVNSVRQIKRGEGISGKALSESKTIVIRLDAYPTERLTGLITQSGFQTMVSAPLMAGGEAIGALNLGFREVRTFSPGELRLLETIGQILGTAMQNTQLYTQVQELVSNLKRSNAELEQFAYIASHDLQEPLRMVSSYMQLIAKRYQGKLDSDADEFIAYAVDGAGRMKSMINDLLTFSRLGTRGKPFQPVDTEAVLNAALENLKLAVEDSHAAVTHDPLPSVLADESQVAQLFQNLIGNALKFHGDEPPRIHVSARKTPQFWEFSVRDNGIGIDPQFFERVFLIFQRLSTRAEHAGSGIGLAICKKIVERHGGRIWIESKPGEGTTFFFTLPAG
jgi:PAS domain S-box-containing protein